LDAWKDPLTFSLHTRDLATHTFAWKLITCTLPTLASLHTHHPNIYASDHCPTCPSQVETREHIFLHCPSHHTEWVHITSRLMATLQHHNPDRNTTPYLSYTNNILSLSWDPGPVASTLIPNTLQHQLVHLNTTHTLTGGLCMVKMTFGTSCGMLGM
jgi:hypothetical protein